MHRAAQLCATLIAATAWTTTYFAAWACIGWTDGKIADGLVLFTSYFTNWSTLLTALVFTRVSIMPDAAREARWVTQALVPCIVMLTLYWWGSSWHIYRDGSLHHILSHGPIPFAVLLYWLVFTPRKLLPWHEILKVPVLGFAYAGWVAVYVSIKNSYPYWQFDPSRVGLRYVATSILEIALLAFGVAASVILLDRKLLPSLFGNQREKRTEAPRPLLERVRHINRLANDRAAIDPDKSE